LINRPKARVLASLPPRSLRSSKSCWRNLALLASWRLPSTLQPGRRSQFRARAPPLARPAWPPTGIGS